MDCVCLKVNAQEIQIISPHTSAQWRDYYHCRWLQLRAPWGQPPGSERDEWEVQAIHCMALECSNQTVVAVGRVHQLNEQFAQIRYMAVVAAFRRRGVGRQVLQHLINNASQRNLIYIFAHVREKALGFYLCQGFQLLQTSHLLYGSIQHYEMLKRLPD